MLKFKETQPTEETGFLYQMISECGKVEIGIFPVIYGFRVRAGYVGDGSCRLDYCCGNSQIMTEILFSMVKNVLEQREAGRSLWIFPKQVRKPFFQNDHEFTEFISMIDSGTFERILLPDLHKLKEEVINELFNKH